MYDITNPYSVMNDFAGIKLAKKYKCMEPVKIPLWGARMNNGKRKLQLLLIEELPAYEYAVLNTHSIMLYTYVIHTINEDGEVLELPDEPAGPTCTCIRDGETTRVENRFILSWNSECKEKNKYIFSDGTGKFQVEISYCGKWKLIKRVPYKLRNHNSKLK